MFKIGTKVFWHSQSSGFKTRKEGVVFQIIPAGIRPEGSNGYPRHKRMFDGWPRDHKSYLIEVRDGKTDKAKIKLYWPRVSQLRKLVEHCPYCGDPKKFHFKKWRCIMPENCSNCAMRCDPVNSGEKAGFCYEKEDFVGATNHCQEWRGSLRDEPLELGPMTPEEMLLAQVACFDTGEEQ